MFYLPDPTEQPYMMLPIDMSLRFLIWLDDFARSYTPEIWCEQWWRDLY